MATLLHALAALVLGNFRFASFFERAHSGFQIREPGFNHLIRQCATHFLLCSLAFLAQPSVAPLGLGLFIGRSDMLGRWANQSAVHREEASQS